MKILESPLIWSLGIKEKKCWPSSLSKLPIPDIENRHTSFSRQICDILNSTDLFLQALIIFTKGANNSGHDCKKERICEISLARLIRI